MGIFDRSNTDFRRIVVSTAGLDGIVAFATDGSLEAASSKIRSRGCKLLWGRDMRSYDRLRYATAIHARVRSE